MTSAPICDRTVSRTCLHGAKSTRRQADLANRSTALQRLDGVCQFLDLGLGLLDTGEKLSALLTPPSDVLPFLIHLSLFNLDIFADSTFFIGVGEIAIVDQFDTASFSHSMLSGATLLHVSPFPVSAGVRSLLIVAHPGGISGYCSRCVSCRRTQPNFDLCSTPNRLCWRLELDPVSVAAMRSACVADWACTGTVWNCLAWRSD